MDYLTIKITSARQTITPQWGIAANGYTVKSGAPTSLLVILEGEKRPRRLMCWQFSNAGTLFLRIRGQEFIVREHDLPNITN